ncbi:heterokaryon incompatibility protein-domain-containing protein [Diplogelasinospora grovesii]|uniref:Heterokaryon incompatibility protein-domain-containing protein n=1 Tax=Diplogelasinospora grovesii TaxID=303347 RepID=A0AAN6N066_9PEZI|nr:heterokaryon incompatibility protein-domain-containing protein [Diplogelasinospora grovesii]
MQPAYFKMKIWTKSDPRSGFKHQIVCFEIPNSEHRQTKNKYAEIYAVPDTPATQYLKERFADPDFCSETNFDLARSWIHDCLENHQACRGGERELLPTRVIEVSPSSENSDWIRLHISKGHEADGRYAALSYCWGKQQTCVTSLESLAANVAGMSLASLHKTIQDAVICTRKLGIPFLWVDALCIVQDSDEDKNREIGMMADIYSHAAVTISAAGAKDCDRGFLKMREDVGERYEQRSGPMPYRCPDGSVGKIFLVPVHHGSLWDNDKTEFIYERAWTHQERMLSPRILTYGYRQLAWQCLVVSRCDFDIEDLHYGSNILDIRRFLHDCDRATLPSKTVIHSWWRDVVQEFSHGRLSVLSDKLLALSATARRFGWALQMESHTYVSGLWLGDEFLKNLTWYSSRPLRIRLPDHFRRPNRGLPKPTWSWASINGPVAYPQSFLHRSPVFTATDSITVDVPFDGYFSEGFLALTGIVLGPLTWSRLAEYFPSRTREHESEEPNDAGMGWVYPDENDELLYAGMVMDQGNHTEHEYWLFELARLGRAKMGLVLRKAKDIPETSKYRRAGLYSMNTRLPETYQKQWEDVALFQTVVLI